MRCLVLYAGVAALLAVCHGCSTGRDFIATFIPNYVGSSSDPPEAHKLQLVVTARASEATVVIEVKSLKFSTQLTLSPGETRRVSVPRGAEMSAVHVSSTADISVVAFNHHLNTGDGTVVTPTDQLGVDYVALPPNGQSYGLIVVVNGDSDNQVTFRGGSGMIKGNSVALKPYETYLMRRKYSLTGMQIKSQKPVAVFFGHQCFRWRTWRCDHTYKQLPPLSQLGKEYIVPAALNSKSWIYIIASEDNTEVSHHIGKFVKVKRILKTAGQYVAMSVSPKQPLFVTGNKKLMVVYVMNVANNYIMMPLIPSDKLANVWSLETVDTQSSTAVIFSERAGSHSVKVCMGSNCHSPKWTAMNVNADWVWTNMALGIGQKHVTVEGDSGMVAYVYGVTRGYAIAGVCSEPLPPATPAPDPCEGVSCREKEVCAKGSCVHVSTATCHAIGDPHYDTFDGRRYDFQGTCTYIMATVIKPDKGHTPFVITTKNDNRGNRRVSYVRTVDIKIYDLNVIISRHKGKVQVNGELVYLPVSLADGRVSVKQSGHYAVLTTDFGLTVRYDWSMQLYISVPSSYYKHMGGLCGNYNGDARDDLPTPTPHSASISSVLKMIHAWKVRDLDRFCQDNCGGHCLSCSKKQQLHYRGPKLCGLLNKQDGLFASCYKTVNPEPYTSNCVYDVCTNHGARQILCASLKSYTDHCLSKGVKVNQQWREIANCPLSCPAGSHYEACGSACPSTCVDQDSEKPCRRSCVEGCFCDKGRVLSGDKCVLRSSCGCQHQGRYHPQGSVFWADDKCGIRCHCDPGSGKATCKPTGCAKTEHCLLKGGVRDCYPLSSATCQGTGDPHYSTFDGRRYDFQGTCTYVLSRTLGRPAGRLAPYQVLVQNENRGRNKAVAYTKAVSLTVYNITVSMSSDSPGRVLVNSHSVNLPYTGLEGKLSLFRQGYFCVVQTQFGLTLKFNWNSYVSLKVPSTYSGSVEGLCGDYNGNAGNDLLKLDKSPAKSPTEFGSSFKVGGDLGCTSECPGGRCLVCEPALTTRYQQRDYCGVISDKAGPFSGCHAKLDHTEYLNDCVFDLCAFKGHFTALCNSLTSYVTVCQTAGAVVKTWRTEQFCPLSCGANSHYEACAEPCPHTCDGLAPPDGCDEDAPCGEGCVCDDGYLLSDDTCVPLAECGCQHDGQYYRSEQVFYSADCRSRCACVAGQVKCHNSFACSANEKCALESGVYSCVPKTSSTCSVAGSRAVTTLDGQSFSLHGDCSFILSEVEVKEGASEGFSLSIHQNTSKDGHVYRSVTLMVYSFEITMNSGVVWEVKIDNVRTNLPLSLASGRLRAHQGGSSIIVETDLGLQVTYDTRAGVALRLPSTFAGATRGLCGNFNSDPSDDLALAGQTGVASFIAAWTVKELPCEPGCKGPTCNETAGGENPKSKYCDIIKSPKGPFAGCHTVVSPLPYFKACAREAKRGQDVVCRHIQAYVSACQSEGATVAEWRLDGFCVASCPSGTHYELCPDTCTSSCAYLSGPARCPRCHEGCQCDGDLVFDGGRCVPAERCGCLVDGQYYKSGVSVVRKDCSERCRCEGGRFTCRAAGCKEEEECVVEDGALGCRPIDPCAEARCRAKERCEVEEGRAVCVPVSKASCTAVGDPHYSTFDGWTYSFQGTCAYVLVNTTGKDPTLPEVLVLTKNELRGKFAGSFVRSVVVELLGHTLEIPSGSRGSVLVDGTREDLPVDLDGGSIIITLSGIRGVLKTDLGIEVTFDWSSYVMVSLSSSYYGNVGGLCGNYNGHREDELAKGDGTRYANVTEWATAWSVSDGDPFCYHHCDSHCPQCSPADQKRFSGPQYCGIAGDKKGPFASCHASVDIEEFLYDCLYDVCVNEGRQDVLCEVLANYNTACQKAGVTVLPWRELANCSLACPVNSHYKLCGPACPETCSPKPDLCPTVCSEGCFCDPGFVLSGETCVDKATGCGCNHENHYYLPGAVFWEDTECNSRCVCNRATRQVVCRQRGCKADEHCAVKDGVQDCFALRFKTCSAKGDPHFHTFDGQKFDFQGNCIYQFASVCKDTKELEKFEISIENDNRGSTKVSYVKTVTVKVYGNTYSLSKDYNGHILVDGQSAYLPFRSNISLVKVHRRNRWAVLETSFLKVSYDWSSSVKVMVATTYQNMLCGLCGNFNNNPQDDLMLANGKAASSAKEFGIGQWLANVPGCSHECKDCAPELDMASVPPAFAAACAIIKKKDGPLGDCVRRLDSEQFYRDCVYDMVQTKGKTASACNIISDYVDDCQLDGGVVKDWRKKNFCWMPCQANSVYSLNAPGCPATCGTPFKCEDSKAESCVCLPGYVLNQDRCVRPEQCDCLFQGKTIPAGRVIRTEGCKQVCSCRRGMVICGAGDCPHGFSCELRKGDFGCHQREGILTQIYKFITG